MLSRCMSLVFVREMLQVSSLFNFLFPLHAIVSLNRAYAECAISDC